MGNILGSKLKIYASKTEQEARDLADTEPGSLCFVKNDGDERNNCIILNGERYSGGLTVAQSVYLTKVMQEEKEKNLVVSISTDKSVYTPGSTAKVTITIKYRGSFIDADSIMVNDLNKFSEVTFTHASLGTYTASVQTLSTASKYAVNLSAIIGITATDTNEEVSKMVSKNVPSYNLIMFGAIGGTLDDINQFHTEGNMDLQVAGPRSSAAGSYTFTNTKNGYYYLLIPTDVTIPSSLSGSNPQGLEGAIPVFFKKRSSTLTADGIEYHVFQIQDLQAPSTHTITFS